MPCDIDTSLSPIELHGCIVFKAMTLEVMRLRVRLCILESAQGNGTW